MNAKWLLFLCLVLVLAGCGIGDDDDGQADTVPTAASTSESTQSDSSPTSTIAPTATSAPTVTAEPTATSITSPTDTPTNQPEPSPTDEPTVTPELAESEVSQDDLLGAMLKLEDLPIGWTTNAPSEDDDSDSGFCNAPPLNDVVAPVADAEVQFQQSEFGPFLTQLLIAYDDDSTAEQAMQNVRNTINCSEWVAVAADGTEQTWNLSPLAFPDLGDDTFVFRTSTIAGFVGSIEIDVVFVRIDNAVTALINSSIGEPVDSEFTVEYAQLAADRIDENL